MEVLMKKYITTALLVSSAALLLTTLGCTYYTEGYLGHQISTNVQLSQANFRIVKSVAGTAAADYICGIGVSEQDLIGRAKRDMVTSTGLTGAQAIVNVTTDVTEMGSFVWSQKKAYASAEVVEFTK
jgi:hypothetical protein